MRPIEPVYEVGHGLEADQSLIVLTDVVHVDETSISISASLMGGCTWPAGTEKRTAYHLHSSRGEHGHG
jgi:hypothetical protein